MTEFWDRRAKQFLVLSLLVLLIFFGLKLAKYFGDIFVVLGLSILIAYLLIGPVDLLTKLVKFRWIAVMLVYLFLFGFIICISIFVAPKVIKEFGEFTRQIPNMIRAIDDLMYNFQVYLNKNNIPIKLPSFSIGVITKFNLFTTSTLENLLGVAVGTVHIVFYSLVTAVTSYYFLLDGHKIVHDLTKYIPKKYESDIHTLVTELDKCLRGFYGGMVKLAAINATVMFTTYVIMKLPYSLLIALWHFISCIIPAVGGWIGLVPAMLVILFTDPFKIWIPLVVYEGFTRLIKDNFITPRIMGDAIGMHPVLVLIAILAGLKAAGLIGVLFALPIFGVLNVILKHYLAKLSEVQEI